MLIPQKSHDELRSEAHSQFDLKGEIETLRGGDLQTERSSRTLIKAGDLRVVLVTARKGCYIKEHRAEGSVTVHVLEGGIRMKLESGAVELHAGELLAMDRG